MKTLLAALLLLAAPGAVAAVAAEVVVGSKKFTESVVLGEMATQLARASGHGGRHVAELGGSRVLWRAVTSGEIDIYPEYTGTLIYEILAAEDLNEKTWPARLLLAIVQRWKDRGLSPEQVPAAEDAADGDRRASRSGARMRWGWWPRARWRAGSIPAAPATASR